MAEDKAELVQKFTGIYEYLYRLEDLRNKAGKCASGVNEAEWALSSRRGTVARIMIYLVISLAGAAGILYWTGNIPRVLALQKLEFSGLLGIAQLAVSSLLLLVAVVSLLRIPLNILRIPGCKSALAAAQERYEEAGAAIDNLCANMADELASANTLFPGDTYPPSRHVKYGIDVLNAGRADTLKEVLALIDEFAHRETMENEAKKQTANTAEAAREASRARRAAETASSAASSARYAAREAARR